MKDNDLTGLNHSCHHYDNDTSIHIHSDLCKCKVDELRQKLKDREDIIEELDKKIKELEDNKL